MSKKIKYDYLSSGFIMVNESPSAAATKYYKCATVDTETATWTGYEAILSGDTYTFAETATTGLTYTTSVPEVGCIYTDTCDVYVESLNVGIPSDSLLLYLPLSSLNTPAPTGQTLTFSNVLPCYHVSCMRYTYTSSGNKISLSDTGFSTGSNPCSISFWVKQSSTSDTKCLFAYGATSAGQQRNFYIRNNKMSLGIGGYELVGTTDIGTGWRHFVGVFDGTNVRGYLDANLEFTGTLSVNTVLGACQLFSSLNNAEPYTGGMSAFRLYGKVLTVSEIRALRLEHAI